VPGLPGRGPLGWGGHCKSRPCTAGMPNTWARQGIASTWQLPLWEPQQALPLCCGQLRAIDGQWLEVGSGVGLGQLVYYGVVP